MRAKEFFAAGGARDGGFGTFARCPGQGWDGPGRKAGVFVLFGLTFPRFTAYCGQRVILFPISKMDIKWLIVCLIYPFSHTQW